MADALTCPACKSSRAVYASDALPRFSSDIRICADCGCLFVPLNTYRKANLEFILEQYAKKESGQS
jgi:hypothetical protein